MVVLIFCLVFYWPSMAFFYLCQYFFIIYLWTASMRQLTMIQSTLHAICGMQVTIWNILRSINGWLDTKFAVWTVIIETYLEIWTGDIRVKITEHRAIFQRERQKKSFNNRKTGKTAMPLTFYRHFQRNGGLNQILQTT